MPKDFKPTQQDLMNAVKRGVEDSLDYNLDIVFCGINPGLYSGATGWPYARPGNRFWKALYLSGLTNRLYHPSEYKDLKKLGIGMTNVVARTSRAEADLKKEEKVDGVEILKQKIVKYKPKKLVILGIGTYKDGFGKKSVSIGLQDEKIGDTQIYVLPNPSGLNANHSVEQIAEMMKSLKKY